jgi:hypothetical protein
VINSLFEELLVDNFEDTRTFKVNDKEESDDDD